jgi:hypothetical protein
MTTLTTMVATRRQPLVVHWHLVTDDHGRTRPQMRWEPQSTATARHDTARVPVAA